MANAVEDTLKRLEVEINATNERLNRHIDATDPTVAHPGLAAPREADYEPPVNPGATASPAGDMTSAVSVTQPTPAPVSDVVAMPAA